MAGSKTKTKVPVEVGQIVHVSYTEGWVRTEREPELEEYTVTRVNGTSFYATREPESDNPYERKFTRREWLSNDKFSLGYYRAYENPETYWDMIHANKLRESRVNSINVRILGASDKQLVDIMNVLGIPDTTLEKEDK